MTYHHLTLSLALLFTSAVALYAFNPPPQSGQKAESKAEATEEMPQKKTENTKPEAESNPVKETADFSFEFFVAVRDLNNTNAADHTVDQTAVKKVDKSVDKAIERAVDKITDKNVIVSPFGAASIGEMLYWGAAGETRDVLATVFQRQDETETAKRFRNGKLEVELPYVSVNGIWFQKDFSFLPTYTGKIEEVFEPEIVAADFNGQAQVECDKINAWIAEATQNRINRLFESLDSTTRLVLVNAIYFQGKWALPFDLAKTQSGEFQCGVTVDDTERNSVEKKVEAKFMNRIDRFLYAETDSCQYLELPYEKNNCSMFVVLPKQGRTLESVESALSAREVDQIRSTMIMENVDCRLPRFHFEADIDLKKVLTTMGAGIIFDVEKADFSGMDGSGKLVVDQAVQKIYISVDEVGTEAAAATGVAVGIKSFSIKEKEPKSFNADRPFFFLIRDNVNDRILFVGQVADPS